MISNAVRNLTLCVDVFFVISGIVIAALYADWVGALHAYANFLRTRIARLIPLHFGTLVFFLVSEADRPVSIGAK